MKTIENIMAAMPSRLIIILIQVLLLSYSPVYATSLPDDNTVYDVVEHQPQYPGGMRELARWLSAHTQYPTDALKDNIEGRVVVKFIVKADGSITAAQVVRSVHPSLDTEALRVVMSMPKWEPGRQDGKAVNVWYSIPVSFLCGTHDNFQTARPRMQQQNEGNRNRPDRRMRMEGERRPMRNTKVQIENAYIVVDNKHVSYEEFSQLRTADIKTISILPAHAAERKYGENAHAGAVEIETK